MLKKNTEIFAGIFDSSILRKGETHTRPRKISSYELEIFQTDSGTVFINEQQYPVKRGRSMHIYVHLYGDGFDEMYSALVSEK